MTFNPSKSICVKPVKLSNVSENGINYCVMQIKKKRKINWSGIERILGDTKTRAVFSDDIMLSENLCECSIDDNAYLNLTASKAIDELLFANKDLVSKKTVVLVDIFCKHQSFAEILVNYFGTVKILTNKPDLYQAFKDNMLYDLGASVTVSNRLMHLSNDIEMIVSPDGVLPSCVNGTKKTISVITVKPIEAKINNVNIINNFELNIPDSFKPSIPHNIQAHKFMAAIYEYCGIRNLSDRYVVYCNYNDERVSFNDVKEKIFNK